MSTQTPNYNLEKPDSTDAFGLFRQLFNDNMDIIDQNLGGGETTTDLFSIFDSLRMSQRYNSGTLAGGEFTFSIDESANDWSSSVTATNTVAVDLTNFDTLRLTIEISDRSDYGHFWVTLSQTAYTWADYQWVSVYENENSNLMIDASGTYDLDVSLLSGNYYIYIGATTGKDSASAGYCDNSHNGKIVGKVTSFVAVESASSIIPNPAGTPTDDLTSIEINGTIYAIAGGGGGGGSVTHEVIHQTNVAIYDNTQVILNLQNDYVDPVVFAVNALPLSQWGGIIVVQSPTVVYDSANDTLTFNVYTNAGQTYGQIDWVVMDKVSSGGGSGGGGQIIDLSSFTKIYDNTIPFGNYGAKIDTILGYTNEIIIALNMQAGWDSAKSSFYDSENQIGAYGGYDFNSALKLDRARFYLGRYSGQNLDLTVTVQYLDSGNTWHDVEDLNVSTTIDYPINSFDVDLSNLGEIYGLRWIHYKNPEKSPSNNICFFGMLMYKG